MRRDRLRLDQVDPLAGPGRSHRRQGGNGARMGVKAAQRISLTAFGAARMKQQVVEIPQHQVLVAFAGATAVIAWLADLEQDLAEQQEGEQLGPGKALETPELGHRLRGRK